MSDINTEIKEASKMYDELQQKRALSLILEMDKASDEFFEIYSKINEKYWTFENPDEYQKAAHALNLILHRGEDWMVEMMLRLATEMFKIVDQGTPAVAGSFGVKGKEVHFTLSTEKSSLANLEKMIRNAVIVKAKEEQP